MKPCIQGAKKIKRDSDKEKTTRKIGTITQKKNESTSFHSAKENES